MNKIMSPLNIGSYYVISRHLRCYMFDIQNSFTLWEIDTRPADSLQGLFREMYYD